MDAARHARVRELFEAALELAIEQRSDFLERECGDDAALGREVAELLRHHDAASGFLMGNARSGGVPVELPMSRLRVPGFVIERELGRGGMGIVVLAQQERPRRAVALKFLRLDSLGPSELKRFEREAEILGRLRHPGIAHVYGVGLAESEQGELPWIAMEYVRGEPLHEHVAGRAPDLRDLIELFTNLCDAVEHAHQAGVVHRDLKPSNVLVDDQGQVRILDFGVARLVRDVPAEGALRTRTGQVVGTLAYASPEQACGDVNQISARSDVYALGVMLHELLTGELPYRVDESRIFEAVQTICDEEPRRLRKARRDAPEDLEIILLKALEKEPGRRYADAGELAADLRRYLAEQPIAARPPTALYQVRKFVRRNRALTLSASSVILALLVTVGVLLVSRRNDRLQFQRTRSMLELMAHEVFRLVPELGFGQEHRDTLEALDARLAEELALAPGDAVLRGFRARSLYELGSLDLVASDHALAGRRFEEARMLREELVREDPADLESSTHLSQIYARLGEVARERQDPEGQRAWFERAFELDQELVREHPEDGELIEDLGWSLERMADLAHRRGDGTERTRLVKWRLDDAMRLVDESTTNWKFLYNAAQAHLQFASLLDHAGQPGAEVHKRAVYDLARRLHQLQPRRAVFQHLWGSANGTWARFLVLSGREEEATPYAEVALGVALQLFANDPGSWLYTSFLCLTSHALFELQHGQGLREQAEATLARLRAAATIVGEESPSGLFLLASAELHLLELQTGSEAASETKERMLNLYQELFLSPKTSTEAFESAAFYVRGARFLPELLSRIQAADEQIGLRLAALVGLSAGSTGLVANEPAKDH